MSSTETSSTFFGVTITPSPPALQTTNSSPPPTTTTPGSTTSLSESGTTSPTSTSTTGDASGTGGTPQEELSSIMFDERGNTWQMQRFNASGSVNQFSRSDTRISTVCPQESFQQTGLNDGSAIIFDLAWATVFLNTTLEFELFVYAPFNTTALVEVGTADSQTTIPVSSDSPQFSSCPFRLTRDNLGIAPGVWVRNITMSPLINSALNPNGTSLWIFNSTVGNNEQSTTTGTTNMPIGTDGFPSVSTGSGRSFDWAFVAIPLAIACALVLGLFVYLYEGKRRNGRGRDGFHDNLLKTSPDSKLGESSASTTLLVPPSTLSLKTGFKSGSAGDKDPRALDRRSSSPLVGSPLLALPSPVAWSPASPASATSFSFQDPFADRGSADGPIRDMGSLYAASEFIRSSSHDPSSRRTSVVSLSQDLHHQSGLRRGSAATSGASSGYESYVTDQMTLVSPGGRRRSSLGSILRKG